MGVAERSSIIILNRPYGLHPDVAITRLTWPEV
jgi:hypothetical protein